MNRYSNIATVQHLASLHSLRGLAALGVFILHLRERLPQLEISSWAPFTSKLFLFVDFFFLLSGIVLAHVYQQQFKNQVDRGAYLTFLVARIARCLPMVAFAAVLAFFTTLCLNLANIGPTPMDVALPALLIEAVGMSAWFDWVWLNPPSWSLTAEFMLYLAVPWLIWATLQLPNKVLWLILIVMPLIPSLLFPIASKLFAQGYGLVAIAGTEWKYFGPQAPWFWFVKGPFILTRAIPMFLAGLAIQQLFARNALVFLPGILPLALSAILTVLAMQFGLPRFIIVIGLVAIAITALSANANNDKSLQHPILFWLGNVSLALYLLHFPIIDLIQASWTLLMDTPLSNAPIPAAAGLFFVVLAISLLAANLAHRVIEKPARRSIRQWWANRTSNTYPPHQRANGHKSPFPTIVAVTALALIALPLGIINQGWLVKIGPIATKAELGTLEWVNEGREIHALIHLKGEGIDLVPVQVQGSGSWVAQIGPNRRNSNLYKPGDTVKIVLHTKDLKPTSPELVLQLPDQKLSLKLDKLTNQKGK